MMPWPEEAVRLLPDLVQLRRAIHSEPELGLRTPKTAAKIMSALAGLLKSEGQQQQAESGVGRP